MKSFTKASRINAITQVIQHLNDGMIYIVASKVSTYSLLPG
jgi:hypothetical protein